MNVRIALVCIVFLLNLLALLSLFATPVRRRTRLRWAVTIVLLPVLGLWLWVRRGPRPGRLVRQQDQAAAAPPLRTQ